jgi:hypothetical protein
MSAAFERPNLSLNPHAFAGGACATSARRRLAWFVRPRMRQPVFARPGALANAGATKVAEVLRKAPRRRLVRERLPIGSLDFRDLLRFRDRCGK